MSDMSDEGIQMNTIERDSFIAFVKKQRSDRVINHTNGWRHCAFGDWSKEQGISHYPSDEFKFAMRSLTLPPALGVGSCINVFELLNQAARRIGDYLELGYDIRTYGALHSLIESAEYFTSSVTGEDS